MNIKKQLTSLIEESPQYGIPPLIMEKGVIPVLTAFAQNLRHEEYYILQNQVGDWLTTTLSHRNNPQIEKTVIYAFGNAQDALKFQKISETGLTAIAIPVTHLLFQLFALPQIDSIIFMDKPGNFSNGVEIAHRDIQNSLQRQLQKQKSAFSAPSNFA